MPQRIRKQVWKASHKARNSCHGLFHFISLSVVIEGRAQLSRGKGTFSSPGQYHYYGMKKQRHTVKRHITKIEKDEAFSPGAGSELKPIFSPLLSAQISIDSPLLDDFAAPCWAVLIWQCTNSARSHSSPLRVYNLNLHDGFIMMSNQWGNTQTDPFFMGLAIVKHTR